MPIRRRRQDDGEQRGRLLGRLEDAGSLRSPEESRQARERAGIRLPEAGPEPEDVDRVSREDNPAMREHFRAERREAGLEDAD